MHFLLHILTSLVPWSQETETQRGRCQSEIRLFLSASIYLLYDFYMQLKKRGEVKIKCLITYKLPAKII